MFNFDLRILVSNVNRYSFYYCAVCYLFLTINNNTPCDHPKMSKTDLFLSHNWSPDEKGRNNHDRVSVINEALKKLGYKCWFDRYFSYSGGENFGTFYSGVDILAKIPFFFPHLFLIYSSFFSDKQKKTFISSSFSGICLFTSTRGPLVLFSRKYSANLIF